MMDEVVVPLTTARAVSVQHLRKAVLILPVHLPTRLGVITIPATETALTIRKSTMKQG